ncbi:alpha/beta fold hydrolase [Microbacterium hominis]|uniref:Alpha/beta hydrolase n=1 Tax=Microbacterium hominis TaxID=162426 RepID=A0A7D4TEX7_9MICO|nr:alpha/beta hydrolase [Microbacterium hominis]QKJ19080.1 alpha/beta hydrolase [Microbacterium hominis]
MTDFAVPYVEEGDGPVALVLLPEHDLSTDALGVVSHYLAEEAGFRIVRVGPRSESESLAARVEDIIAVLDRIGLERAWIGGHAEGGTVARAFVAAHGDRTNGLLLLGVEDADIALAPVIPVLIIQGSDDEVTPPAHGTALQQTAPERVTVRSIDGGGHLFPMTDPVETAVFIEEYLDWD